MRDVPGLLSRLHRRLRGPSTNSGALDGADARTDPSADAHSDRRLSHARAFPRAHHPATDAGSHRPASARTGVLRRRVRRGRPRGRLLLRQRLPHVPGLLPGRLLAVPRGGRLRLTTTATTTDDESTTGERTPNPREARRYQFRSR